MTRNRDEYANQPGSTPHQGDARGSSRREFTKTLAALALTPLLRPSIAPASTDELIPGASADLWASIPQGLQAQTPEKPLPEAEALAEVARILYGKNLNDDQMAEVKRSLSGRFRAAEAMKKTRLANGDEPAFIFSANP